MKGQIKIEFIFSIVVFSIIILFLSARISDSIQESLRDNKRDYMIKKSEDILSWLVEQGGEDNWESDPLNAKRIGLAYSPYNLSIAKIIALNNSRDADNKCILMEKFGLSGYRLTIFNSTDKMLSCGAVGFPEVLIIKTRNVLIENELGNITLELFL